MTENDFNSLMSQEEKPVNEDPTGLFTVLKNIEGRKCSCGYLCIEIGAIYGDFDSLKPKNITIPIEEKRKVHMIIKPIIIVNSTKEEPQQKDIPWADLFENDDDCDELKLSGNFQGPSKFRFKQHPGIIVKRTNIQRKFYRKVAVGEFVYSKETFKQGLNLIIVDRDKTYTKLYENTFDTNNSRKASEEMAEILQGVSCSKIVIITGIGKWMGAVTPGLIKEIKQIGGPDLNNLYSPDKDDNSKVDHAFILIGRRGLCRFNGIFRIKNYDVTKDMKQLYPDLSSDPNDCYFDSISLENEKNRRSDKSFYHIIDMRLTLNINNDNRFAWDAPTVSSVSPFKGSIHGGQEIKIGGFNFGYHTTDIQEILVKGVVCGDFLLLSPNLLSCVTRASTILGPGGGNVVIKLKNGYESPKRTCNVFEYVGDSQEALDDLKATIVKVDQMQNIPIYMNSHVNDNNISIFDHLLFNDAYHKQKLQPDHSNLAAKKIDNMVRGNYENLINILQTDTNVQSSDKFRKRRFKKILNNLEVCDDK